MALSTDRSTAAQDSTPSSSTAQTLHRRRDMAVVWWSTYLSLIFLAFFIYGLSAVLRVAQDPQPIALVAAVLGAFTMVLWALTLLRARRGIDRTTFRSRSMVWAFFQALATALVSVGASPTFGVGALPLAFVLAISALSLAKGR